MATTWLWRQFDALTNQQLYELLALRQEVFGIEQKCLYQDLDFKDQQAHHLLGYNNERLVAYLRLFPRNTLYTDAISFGRVLTASSERGKGLAKEAMKQTLNYLKEKNWHDRVEISAQLYLKKFYEDHGLSANGDPYDEDGILHIHMTSVLPASFTVFRAG